MAAKEAVAHVGGEESAWAARHESLVDVALPGRAGAALVQGGLVAGRKTENVTENVTAPILPSPTRPNSGIDVDVLHRRPYLLVTKLFWAPDRSQLRNSKSREACLMRVRSPPPVPQVFSCLPHSPSPAASRNITLIVPNTTADLLSTLTKQRQPLLPV